MVKHHRANFFEQDQPNEFAVGLNDRVDVALASGDSFHELSEGHFGTNGVKIAFDLVGELHERENSLVLVMRNELTFVCQFLGVDAVGSHPSGRLKGDGAGEHEGNEQVISTAGLCRQKDGREGSAQDAGHQSGHAGEYKVTSNEVPTRKQQVGGQQKDAAQECPADQGRGEDASNTASPNGESSECRFACP